LGRAISQQIITLMGGHIHVESELGQGSTFWFELALPLAGEQTLADTTQTPVVVGYEGDRRRVLVVDDHPENRLVLVNMLEPLGFDLLEAADGQEGYDLALAHGPHLVITDVVMPHLDGLTLAQRLRQHPTLAPVPIIASPASISQVDRRDSEAAGCDRFLPKPIALPDLLGAIAELLSLTWIYRQPAAPTAADPEPTPTIAMPPAAELRQIYQAAQGGFIQDLQAEAQRLQALSETYHPFVQQLLTLVQAFDDEGIVQWIQPYLDAEVSHGR
jgi:CheY-like chemotaxis protein